MWISHLTAENVRSFAKVEVAFSRGINVLIGQNNSGKSTILRILLSLQEGLPGLDRGDLRVGADKGGAAVTFDLEKTSFQPNDFQGVTFEFVPGGVATKSLLYSGEAPNFQRFPNREPKNFIYPFLTKRKVTGLDEAINEEVATQVPPNFQRLNAKIDRVSNSDFLPANEMYVSACRDILGFTITSTQSGGGKRAAYTVRNFDNIPLSSMGEGVMNILGLVVDLCVAEGKLFLVEELENDIHPRALKALMKFISERAEKNQFIITTHSNIVTKYLGARSDTKLFHATISYPNRVPTSDIKEVSNSSEDRLAILESLGYELSDFDLWDGWLFFEESSAEKIVKEYLIPWYVLTLRGKLQTFSAQGIGKVRAKFDDFNGLFVFLNLSPAYSGKVWVILDDGPDEAQIIKRMQEMYVPKGWRQEHFQQFSQHDFELYYPNIFAADVADALGGKDDQKKRAKKKELLRKVEEWIAKDEEAAKKEFAVSAAEVIERLQAIAKAIS